MKESSLLHVAEKSWIKTRAVKALIFLMR